MGKSLFKRSSAVLYHCCSWTASFTTLCYRDRRWLLLFELDLHPNVVAVALPILHDERVIRSSEMRLARQLEVVLHLTQRGRADEILFMAESVHITDPFLKGVALALAVPQSFPKER